MGFTAIDRLIAIAFASDYNAGGGNEKQIAFQIKNEDKWQPRPLPASLLFFTSYIDLVFAGPAQGLDFLSQAKVRRSIRPSLPAIIG